MALPNQIHCRSVKTDPKTEKNIKEIKKINKTNIICGGRTDNISRNFMINDAHKRFKSTAYIFL